MTHLCVHPLFLLYERVHTSREIEDFLEQLSSHPNFYEKRCVSSSSPIFATVPVRYNRGKEYLASKGIRVIAGALFGKQDYYRSGSIKERADEFISWSEQNICQK